MEKTELYGPLAKYTGSNTQRCKPIGYEKDYAGISCC